MKFKSASILIPRLHTGDAVANDALGMQSALEKIGIKATIYAGDGEIPGQYSSITEIPSDSENLLIYHYAIAWEPALQIWRNHRGEKVLRYHNVTPGRFYRQYHAGIADACDRAREEVFDFDDCDLIMAVSQYNASDLVSRRNVQSDIVIVPVFHRTEELLERQPDLRYLRKMNLRSSPVILSLGRIVPNKGYESLLRGFANFIRKSKSEAILIICGKKNPAIGQYYKELDRIVQQENIKQYVRFTGEVTEAQLKSLYCQSDVFVSCSYHEGFCLPIIESYAFRIPVIARNCSALAETASSGILLDNPEESLGQGLEEVLETKASLTEMAYQRYSMNFRPDIIGASFLNALGLKEESMGLKVDNYAG